jgi:hypothetical protein
MAENNRELVRNIGANLQDRLPLDHSLPAVFVSLLADLDAAEDKRAAEVPEARSVKNGMA